MDALSRTFRNAVPLLISPLLAAVVLTPGNCLAGGSTTCHSWCCPFVDGCTLRGWHRTWHGPNALATPLSGYYIPRTPAGCDCDGCADGCGDAVAESYTFWPMDCDCDPAADCYPAAVALEPTGFERLGQIPNDLELSVGVPVASPNRPVR